MPAPQEFFDFITANADAFINRLGQAVAIPSVSADKDLRDDVIAMGSWLNNELKNLGVDTVVVDLGTETLHGEDVPLPPIILGKHGNDQAKKTVLVYGHYDVQPADASDGWVSNPFTLDIKGDRFYGRGTTDDKGPILGWLNVLQYHHEKNVPLPVNLVFCFEGMEESTSIGIDEVIIRESKPGGYFHGVDCVSISDNYWLNTRTPCLTYGLRGVFGGTVFEPMTDLIQVLSTLVDSHGKILIPGINEMVPPPTDEEKEIYGKIDYTVADLEESAGASIGLSSDKVVLLMGRMREPSLSIHDIGGGGGASTVIPGKVSARFSLRLVPNQTPELVNDIVIAHLKREFAKLNSKNTLTIEKPESGDPWVADHKHWNYEAARKATMAIYKQDPDMTREGGSIPVTLTFANSLGVNVCLLPMGRADDGAHSINEKIDRSNFIEGSKLLGAYLYEIADIHTKA